jgi:uncharacterized membrane protein YczE
VTGGRLAQLFGSCLVLALGIVLLLRAALGSDGYSTFVTGMTRASGWNFAVVNTLVGLALIALAWARGLRPGIGTVAQTVVVGAGVSLGLAATAEPASLAVRCLLLAAALPVLALGVAGYLNTATGAGPAEAAALAAEPAVPFRWGYNALQGAGALFGWLGGADVGIGTLLVVVALGPAVQAARARLPRWDEPAGTVQPAS